MKFFYRYSILRASSADYSSLFPADYSSLVPYIFSLSTTNNTFIFFVVSVEVYYSKDGVEGGISYIWVRWKCILAITKNILVLAIELLICWSTFYCKMWFLLDFGIGGGMSNLLEMFLKQPRDSLYLCSLFISLLMVRNKDFNEKISSNSFSMWLSKCSHPSFHISR